MSVSDLYRKTAEKTATFLLPYMKNKHKEDEYLYDKLRYSADFILRDISKSMVLFFIAIPLGVIHYILVYMIAYGFLGRVTFGFHVKSSVLCNVFGLGYYLGSVYLSKTFLIPLPILVGVFLLCGVILFIYAPAESKNRPISEKRRKELKPHIVLRYLVLFFLSVLFWFIFENKVYSSLIFYSVVCRTINVMPFFTYKREHREEVTK